MCVFLPCMHILTCRIAHSDTEDSDIMYFDSDTAFSDSDTISSNTLSSDTQYSDTLYTDSEDECEEVDSML